MHEGELRMNRLTEFVQVYRLYRNHHNPAYAMRIAYGIVFRNLPF